MKRSTSLSGAFTLALVLLAGIITAQTTIPVNTIVTQHFNSMASGLPLPANWRISAAGGGATATWATGAGSVSQAANSGTPTTGGAYNWGTTAGTDRAVGFLSSGSYASPNAVMGFFRNTTGATVTTLTISFVIERYRINTSGFTLSFFSSTDGTAWTARTAGDIGTGVFAGGASSYTFGTPQTLYKTVTLTGLSIANNGDFYFRWVFTDAVAANAQGLGLDNVSVFAGTATPRVLATLLDLQVTDNPPIGQVNPGDDIRYVTTIKNAGSGDANNVVLTEPAPANTTLVGGSIKTSALARDDSYTTNINTTLNVGAAGVLSNDYGVPSPTVLSFGPTANSSATAAGGAGSSDNGGAVTVNANGSFSYIPPSATFTGTDKFSYKATTGNAPDNDGFVTITIGTAPTANNDAYNVIGNMQISPNVAAGLLNNDAGSGISITAVNGSAANVGSMFVTANGSNITVNANGSFTYNPGKGFDGPTETFTYTIDNGFASPQTATVTLNISGMVWFVNSAAAAGGDGRFTNPFNTLDAFQAANLGGAGQPAANDHIFVYEGAAYASTTNLTLLSGQKLIGQDASAQLTTITGLTPNVTYSSQFPLTAPGAPFATLTTSAAGIHAITLGTGNTVRGLTIGNTGTGTKIRGTGFGTVTLGDNTTPDLILNGTGQALNLTTGAFSAASAFASVASTSSATQGIILTGVTGPAGTVNFGSTTISGSTTQGILVGTTTANINFGNTSVSASTDGVSLQNNSAGTRTFGTLSITVPGANVGFLHAVGGGISVAGTTTISNGTGNGIDIQNNTTSVTFGATTVTKSGAGNAINIANTGATAGNITFTGVTLGTSGTRLTGPAISITNTGGTNTSVYAFGAVSIFTNAATGIIATNVDGTINTSSGTVDVTGAAAMSIAGPAGITTLGMTLTTVNSNGGTNNVSFVNCGGTATLNGGTLTGTAAGATFNVSGGTAGITYSGGITQATNAVMVSIAGGHATGTITFQTGTLSATNGTGLQFNNADGTYNFNGTTTLNGGDAAIDVFGGSQGTLSFGSGTSINNPSGIAFRESASNANITYGGTITKTNNTLQAVQTNAKAGGTTTFNGQITATTATGIAIDLTSNTGGTINFSGNNLVITTTTGTGFNATGGGTVSVTGTGNVINCTSGGTGVNVASTNIGASGLTFLSITSNAGTVPGIILTNSGSGGLTVTGDGGGTNNGSGGSISNKTGSYIPAGAYGTATGSGTPGVRLINASNVRLKYMNITGNNHSGIFGGNPGFNGVTPYTASCNGFQLVRCNITGNGNETNSNPDETGVDMYDLSGTAIGGSNPTSIDNCVISNNWEFEVQIVCNTGTITDFQINNSTISSNGATGGHGNLINFIAYGTGNITLNVVGGSYTGAAPATATAIHADASSNGSSVTANISGATFTNNNVATSVSTALGGIATFNIANNTATGNRSIGMNVFASANGPFTSLIRGKFLNNTIGTLGVANSGSNLGSGIRVQNEGAVPINLLINGNTIQEITSFQGITVNVGLSGIATGGQLTSLTITNNIIRNINGSRAMAIQDNQSTPNAPAPTLCTNISGNVMSNVFGQAGDGTFIRIRRLNGIFNVTQASLAAIEAANTCDGGSCSGKFTASGTITYGQPACTLPNN